MTRTLHAARWLPRLWAIALTMLILGPALGPGYVLSFDMVWVPDLAFRSDFLGLGSGLPRAVPSDAVVAVLDEVIPGMLLQKVVLVGALLLAAEGALRLAGCSTVARTMVVTVTVWNPFVAERLVIGHWPVLLGYAVAPWLVHHARRIHATGRISRWLYLLLPLGCLSASAGLVTTVLVLAFGLRRGPVAAAVRLVLLCAAANAPWLVASFLGPADTTPPSVAAALFNLRSEGGVPAPLTALGLGGIWNSAVVPGSRTGLATALALVGLVLLVLVGARRWWRRTDRPLPWVLCWTLGWSVAVFGWAAPGVLEWLGSTVPGAGLLRDGTRYYALCLPLLVGLVGAGTEVLAESVRRSLGAVAAAAGAAALVLLPVAAMPDAAWGVGGQLRSVDFPSGWQSARDALAEQAAEREGVVLVLPFTAYRAPSWNHGHRVLDPLGRYLTPNYLSSDELSVGGRVIPGDDPRVPAVRRALAHVDPVQRSASLSALGVRFVAHERQVRAPADLDPAVVGRPVATNDQLGIVELSGDPAQRSRSRVILVMVIAAWGMFCAVPWLSLLDRAPPPAR